MTKFVLPEFITPTPDELDAPFWEALREERLVVQWCAVCRRWLWGPEWICPICRRFDVGWVEVARRHGEYVGRIYSWERVWHPSRPALADAVPYVVLLVELPDAGSVRLIGNRIGDQESVVEIGAAVRARFEHHEHFTLLQWLPD